MIKTGLNYLEKEVAEIEKQMDKYKVPMPSRSPKSVKSYNANDSSLVNDQFIFEQIRDGCVAAVERA
jgi:CDP-diacylglycerol pyrophosphatase